jgi:membrane protease YdiL (CAAX protease family)
MARVPRWVHPDVISRAASISLAAALGLLALDYLIAMVFHAGGGAAMMPVEVATGGWIHHSLAWGAITSSLFTVIALVVGVRLRQLGIDRRELKRWLATALISWCAVQLVMVTLAQAGVIAPLRTLASLPESVGIMVALLVHTGLFEEVLARGIVLPVLVRRLGMAVGISVSALAFGLGHLPAISQDDASVVDAVASVGQYWCWAVVDNVLYLRCASLLTLAALHAVRDWPTPFAISDRMYMLLYVGLYVGGALYIWLRRWPARPEMC